MPLSSLSLCDYSRDPLRSLSGTVHSFVPLVPQSSTNLTRLKRIETLHFFHVKYMEYGLKK